MSKRTAAILLLLSLLFLSGGCRKKRTVTGQDIALANKVSSRTVALFFETPESLLAPESRTLALPENEGAAINLVMKELLKGSVNVAVPRLLPPAVELRASFLLPDGTAIIDLGGPALATQWSIGTHGELMAVYGVVQTLCANFKSVRRVRILVNGQQAETFAGHVQIDKALVPLASLTRRG